MRIRTLFISFILLACTQASFAADTTSVTKKVSVFTVLKVQGDFNVVLTQGSECSLKVNGDKDAVAAVDAKNSGVTLNVTGGKGNVTLYVTFKDINQISINGACKVSGTKQIKTGDLALNLDGKTEGSLDMKVKVFTFNCNTDSNFSLSGKADKGNAKVDGEGAIDMSQLKIDDLNIEYSGDNDIKIYAHPNLHVKMSGAGNLIYYGNPRVKVFKVDGNGMPKEGK